MVAEIMAVVLTVMETVNTTRKEDSFPPTSNYKKKIMIESVKKLIIRIKYEFLWTHNEKYLENTAKGWTRSLENLKLNINEDELQRAYEYGLKLNLFTYGVTIQNLITAIQKYLEYKKTKLDRRLL